MLISITDYQSKKNNQNLTILSYHSLKFFLELYQLNVDAF